MCCGLLLRSLSLLSLFLASCNGLESVDVFKPIVKISPARSPVTGSPTTDDFFGYSVALHRLFSDPTGMTVEEILNQTLIMVGAPRGAYPGGLSTSEIVPNKMACQRQYDESELELLNTSQILECYRNDVTGMNNRTGLVYQCPLSVGNCGAALGNGNASQPDGLLFDRVGNNRIYQLPISSRTNPLDRFFVQNKNGQQMGATVFSEDGYFVACAPLWEYVEPRDIESQPRGQCVYSERSLTDFLILKPCDVGGSATNQQREGYCETGFSVGLSTTNASANSSEYTEGPWMLTGVPGRRFSSGGVFYYNGLNATSKLVDITGQTQIPLVNASVGASDNPSRRRNFTTVYEDHFSYYGFAIASGFFTDRINKGFIVSSPRYTEFTQIGRVYIITEIDVLPTLYVDGEQYGEYFGYSLAVADLNGDGWDDFLVGAPIYSQPFSNDLGRVFVYMNEGGVNFTVSAVINGQQSNGRFGIAITSLGDLNNDGFDDVAISAPFEGSGAIYIYYGQEMDEQGSIINTTAQQRIDGSTLVSQVTNLTSVSSFGFSLDGKVDIDQNGYRDLLVGAYESQAVFLLRSIPVAVTSISMTTDVAEINLGNHECQFDGRPIICFTVTVCSQYTGRGLESGFNTSYQLREVTLPRQAARLFFQTPTSNSVTRSISYPGENTPVCINNTVYVMNTTNFDDIQLQVSLDPIQRNTDPVNTVSEITSFSSFPVISANSFDLTVPVVRECGPDAVCNPDLVLTVVNTSFLLRNGSTYPNLAVGPVDRVRIEFRIYNNREDSFSPFVTFTIPKAYFIQPRITPLSLFIDCNDTTPDNTTHGNYMCIGLKTPFSMDDGNLTLFLLLQVRPNSLRGLEGTLQVPIGVRNPTFNFSVELPSNLTNNDETVNMRVIAASNYEVSVLYPSEQLEYQANGSSFTGNRVSTLGSEVALTVDFRNNGPSQIVNGTLYIYIPSFSEETRPFYYYYPVSIVSQLESNFMCNTSGLNPEGYVIDSSTTKRRRRRSSDGHHTSDSSNYRRLLTRQSATTDPVVDCRLPPRTGCITVSCDFTSFIGTQVIRIRGFLDERFFENKVDSYILEAFAAVVITDGITNPQNAMGNSSRRLELTNIVLQVTSSSIPWYVIVAPVAGAFIFILILGIVLYCFGFFQRKKHGKKDDKTDGDDFEQFAADPFANANNPPPPPVAATAPEKDDIDGTKL